MTIKLKITDNQKAQVLLNFLSTLDYVQIEQEKDEDEIFDLALLEKQRQARKTKTLPAEALKEKINELLNS